MPHIGGKSAKKSSSSTTKRHFTVVMGNKEHGLYVSSSPSSAARKAVSKLCATNKKKKVQFHIREITQGSKKKTYGPYLGEIEKLAKPIELKGRVIKYKPVAKLTDKKTKTGGAKKKGSVLVVQSKDGKVSKKYITKKQADKHMKPRHKRLDLSMDKSMKKLHKSMKKGMKPLHKSMDKSMKKLHKSMRGGDVQFSGKVSKKDFEMYSNFPNVLEKINKLSQEPYLFFGNRKDWYAFVVYNKGILKGYKRAVFDHLIKMPKSYDFSMSPERSEQIVEEYPINEIPIYDLIDLDKYLQMKRMIHDTPTYCQTIYEAVMEELNTNKRILEISEQKKMGFLQNFNPPFVV
jgi:hypothetical protein